MEWLSLILVGFIYCICSWLTYSEDIRQKWYFIPLAVLLGTIVSLIWFCTVRYIDNKQKIYVYSLFWDFVMMGVYYIYPIIFLGIKLDGWSVFGLFLILTGVIIIKLRSCV